ncbi:MAG: hypothetical protein IT428_22030 [Planctomycetaceae bacterium]|nr:hypothetical protein [Planctomycetaceae bacterium]
MRTVLWSSVLSFVGLAAATVARAESFPVDEPTSDTRVFQVSARQVITGNLETSLSNGKSQALPLSVDAVQKYLERRLPAAGREAEAYRSLRSYQAAESKIDVEKTHSSGRLVAARSLVVSQGRREGISRYSPNGAMTRADVDLLNVPGDSLALLALLPKSNVENGEKWTPEAWVLQSLAGIDAVTKSELSCEIESVTADVAVVKFAGTIEGATVGAAATVSISGKLRYDRKGRYVRSVEMEQKEKRSVGAVSPGLNVTAKVTIERSPSADQGPLTDAAAEKIPLEPDVSVLMLYYDAPWGIRMVHDRDWHVFHQSGDAAILRLLDKGSLIAQCNLHLMTPAKAGQHTSEDSFQADIQKGLGDQFKSFAGAEEIKSDDGRYLYRVIVDGEGKSKADNAVKPIPMKWIYYLCASPSGQQTSMAFAVQADLLEKLGNRDLAMVKSLKFLTPMTAKAP